MLAPPRPPADPEALIPEARERQRRRQMVLAAAIAVAAGLGIAVYALVGGLGPKSTTNSSPRAGAPLCRSSQLAASESSGASAGSVLDEVIVANTGEEHARFPVGSRDWRSSSGERLCPSTKSRGRPAFWTHLDGRPGTYSLRERMHSSRSRGATSAHAQLRRRKRGASPSSPASLTVYGSRLRKPRPTFPARSSRAAARTPVRLSLRVRCCATARAGCCRACGEAAARLSRALSSARR